MWRSLRHNLVTFRSLRRTKNRIYSVQTHLKIVYQDSKLNSNSLLVPVRVGLVYSIGYFDIWIVTSKNLSLAIVFEQQNNIQNNA